MRDVIAKGIKPAMAKYLFGSEHGGRAQALDLATLDKDQKSFRNTPQNRAQKIGEDINAGACGAYQRMIGSVETFYMRLGQVNDGPLTKFYDKVGNSVDAISNLPNGVLQAGTAIGGLAGAAIVARGALGVLRVGRDLLGFGGGAALTGSAAALTTSAGLLDAAAIKLAGGSLHGGAGGTVKDGVKKAGSALPLLAGGAILGGTAAIGYVLSEYGDASKSVNGTGGRPDFGMNPGDELPGLSGSTDAPSYATRTAPSMIVRPGEAPLTLYGSGLNTFGLTGPQSPEALAKRDAERYTRALVDARSSAAPLNPGDELPGLGPEMATKAQEKGAEAGKKAGDGIKQGLSEQAPAVEAQGLSIMQRLQQLFSAGIFVPIHMQVDGAGGGGGGSLIQRASLGGGGGGAGGGGGGGTGGGGSMPAVPGSVQMTAAERNELGLIGRYESGGQNVPNYINDRTHTAQGYYQITNTNWRRLAPRLGISARSAMGASLEDQTRVALALRRESGLGNWTRYNPRLRGALGRGEQFRPAQPPPAPEPPTVPEAPPAIARSQRAGMDDLREHIAELGRHVDRFGESSMYARLEVVPTGGLRAKSMRVRSSGGLSADLGMSMPDLHHGDGSDASDWS